MTSSSFVDDSRLNGLKTDRILLEPRELAFQRLQAYAERTRLPMACIDRATGVVLAASVDGFRPYLPPDVEAILCDVTDVTVIDHASGLLFFAVPLPDVSQEKTVAVGHVRSRPDVHADDLGFAFLNEFESQSALEDWLGQQPHCDAGVLKSLLDLAVSGFEQNTQVGVLESEVNSLSEQIDYRYEEITLLHNLTQNLQISRAIAEVAELCLDRVHELIGAAGSIIWLDDNKEPRHFLVEGEIPFDELGMAKLIARFEDHNWSKPLVLNNIQHTLLGADFPGLESLVVVSISEGHHRWGWFVSCNRDHAREFGSVEARLMNSIAAILGTHMGNIDLYRQYDELLLSFVRSLVSTLDAKDPYTRGHSERVALIARRLGSELDLPESDLQDIYLSGLLHDIGKIGVDDGILQKPDQLTDEEFKKIQQHPTIGYTILAGLKNLQPVLPGVRNHHESYDGSGYPDGLRGEEIPMMARILAVADAYDAMGSDRPYRKGMDLDRLEDIFRRGSDRQWDSRIIGAYFTARDDIKTICKTYSPADSNLLGTPQSPQPLPSRT